MSLLKRISRIHILDKRLILLTFALMQFGFWFFITSNIKPPLVITEEPPTKPEALIYGLGDIQFAYRISGQRLQNAGDRYGETIPLQDYDYPKLQRWFMALDALDNVSDYVPSVAGLYYSQSQNNEHSKYIIDYLVSNADSNPSAKWRWYVESLYLAVHKLRDFNRASMIGKKLLEIDDGIMPPWVRLMTPLMLRQNGDICAAYNLLKNITDDDLTAIAEDKILNVGGQDNNMIAKFMISKLRQLKNNRHLLYKCSQI